MSKKILSVKDLVVKFRVNNQTLTAIRNINLDVYEGETLAIVGESGSGKSVLTKTFTDMLEDNGYIANGSIEYYGDDETVDLVKLHRDELGWSDEHQIRSLNKKRIRSLQKEIDLINENDIDKIQELVKSLNEKKQNLLVKNKHNKNQYKINQIDKQLDDWKDFVSTTNDIHLKQNTLDRLNRQIKDLEVENSYFKEASLAKKYKANKELRKIRGGIISTIFQDPMTSLNPLLSVGYQLMEAIRAHRDVSIPEAKKIAVDLLTKVGIPNPETRMKEVPGKYSGGMRQRIVIAIALATQPKILIADEPTTALDVTIQAEILKLIKDLKKEFNLTVIFITHDLGVVANIADRVAVLYAGEILEYGLTDEIFYDPKHPYTWALLSSLPQLGIKGNELYAINGTPPSLYADIKGDPFAPRNKYALEVDYLYKPPFYKVSPTHYAATWLLDKRSPKIKKPEILNHLKDIINK